MITEEKGYEMENISINHFLKRGLTFGTCKNYIIKHHNIYSISELMNRQFLIKIQ